MKSKTASTLSQLTTPDAERDHILGNPDGDIMILEYGDYECPYCAEAQDAVTQLSELLGDRLCYAFRNFPLLKHPNATTAALAAEAAKDDSEFWQIHELLFENQDTLDDLEVLLDGGGFDAARIMKAVRSGAKKDRVSEDREMGKHAGVGGTPTFFINGDLYDGEIDAGSILEFLGE